jgi:cell division protein FtsI (penicillin-binding protein 3)
LIIAQVVYLQFFTDLKDKAERIRKETIQASRGNIYTHDMQLLSVSISKYDVRVDFYALKTNLVENDAKKMSLYYNKLEKDLKNKIKELGLQSKDEIQKLRNELKSRIKEKSKSDTVNANNYINSQIKSLADSLSNLFKDKSTAEYESFIKTCCRKSIEKIDTTKNKAQESYRNQRIGQRNIDYIELKKLLNFPIFRLGKGISGLITNEKTFRIPVYGSLAQAVIGEVNSNNLAINGIEKSFDKYLCGKNGSQAMSGGKPVNSDMNILPESGYDVVTTLDLNVQEAVENALMQQIKLGNDKGIAIEGGTAIVMETATGEIRAIANMKRNSDGTYDETYNYALKERSDPGSTFKLASLIALLDDGFVKLNDIIDVKANAEIINRKKMVWEYKGYKINDDHVFGNLSVRKIFANSSNIGTAKLVTKYYGNNPQTFFDKLHSIGLLQESLNLQIDGEAPSYAEMETVKNPRQNLLAPSSYGYYVKFAPIHTLTFYNAVANDGKMMKPKFVKKIIRHGQVIKYYPDEVIKDQICSKETLLKAREALQSVADSGTVKQFKLPFYFAGKTGTSQRTMHRFVKQVKDTIINGVKQQITDSIRKSYYANDAHQASFVGYIPSDKPKYSIIVALYSPKMQGAFYGSTYAAPVFVEIAKKLYSSDINWYEPVERNEDSLYLPNVKNTVAQRIKTIASKLDIPVDNDAKNSDWVKVSKNGSKLATVKIQIDDNKVPSVINMGLRNAVYLLEKSGMKVSFSGKGKVQTQSIAAGTSVIKGATIHLELEI